MTNISGLRSVARDKEFWKQFLPLVIPIALQSLLSNAVNSADVIMVGKVGQTELSAVSLANQFQFLMNGLAFGLNSGITIMGSQYWGKRNTDTIQMILGIAWKIAFAISLIITMSTFFFSRSMMRIYTNDASLIAIGAEYLRVLAPAYLMWGFSDVYLTMLRSVERATKAAVFSSAALILNVVLNAVFIFGLGPIPAMGVKGAAAATVIARGVEFLLCLLDAVLGKTLRFSAKKILTRRAILTKDYFRYAGPAALTDISWTIAFSIYSVIMGHLNADIVAANSVAVTVRNLCAVLANAFGTGACVMIGIKIGEGGIDEVKTQADFFCWLILLLSILTGGFILLIRPAVLQYFALESQAQEYLNTMLFINAFYIIGQIMNMLLIGGVFRAGGHTKWGLICITAVMWGVSLPLGFLAAFVLKLPPMAVYAILCLDEAWKLPFVIHHYRSYTWLKDITRQIPA